MKVSHLFVASVLACWLMMFGLASTSFGAIVFRMNDVSSPVLGQVSTNVYLVWDGTGQNTISGIEVVFNSPSSLLTIVGDSNPPNPLNFQSSEITYDSNNNAATVTFDNSLVGNVAALCVGDNLLTSITFNASGSGTFPIDLTLISATRGGLFDREDIGSEIVLDGGTVSAVPEPSSLALLGFATVGGLLVRRRRKSRTDSNT